MSEWSEELEVSWHKAMEHPLPDEAFAPVLNSEVRAALVEIRRLREEVSGLRSKLAYMIGYMGPDEIAAGLLGKVPEVGHVAIEGARRMQEKCVALLEEAAKPIGADSAFSALGAIRALRPEDVL